MVKASAPVSVTAGVGESLADQTDYINALFYGPYGSGKTTCAARMARLGPVVAVNVEGGLKAKPLRERGVPVENIRVVNKRSLEDLEDLFWTLKGDLDDDPGCWAGVILDSGSELNQRFLEEQRVAGYARKLAKAERQGVEVEHSEWFIDRDYWGPVTGQTAKVIRMFLDLPCHFVVTALPRRDQDDDGRVVYGPAVNPAASAIYTGLTDIVGWFEEEDGLYTARFKGTRTKGAKDRLGGLPARLVDPYFDRIADYISGTITEGDDPLQEALLDDTPPPDPEEGSQHPPRRRPAKG